LLFDNIHIHTHTHIQMHRHYGYENCAYHGIVFDYRGSPKRKPVGGMLASNGLLTTHTPAIYISLSLPHSLFRSLSLCLCVCDRRLQAAVKTIFRLAFQTFYGFISTKISPLNTQIVACHSCFIRAITPCCPYLSLSHSLARLYSQTQPLQWSTVNSLP